jgi:hypothetical protein
MMAYPKAECSRQPIPGPLSKSPFVNWVLSGNNPAGLAAIKNSFCFWGSGGPRISYLDCVYHVLSESARTIEAGKDKMQINKNMKPRSKVL